MDSTHPAKRRRYLSLKVLSLVAAAAALLVMGVVSVVAATSDDTSGRSLVIAGKTTVETTPTVPSAAPAMRSAPWRGGDWPGF